MQLIDFIENLILNNPWESLATTAIVAASLFWAYVIHASTWMDRLRLTLFLVMLPVLAIVIWFTGGFRAHVIMTAPAEYYKLGIMPLILFVYLVAYYTSMFLAAYIKGGFGNLKKYSKKGLKYFLPLGLAFGAIGTINGLMSTTPITGMIVWSVVGLIFGFILMSFIGWISELREEEFDQ